jgi:hypothetical protein
MNNFNFVIYSHSDYLDVLKIQTDYTTNVRNRVLLINEQFDDNEILSKYNKVIRYNDSQPYSNRLQNLKTLECEYILFIHDIDILIQYNENFINSCVTKMQDDKIDRIDLQYYDTNWNPNTNRIKISCGENHLQLIKQENINGYIYNVNPSIWKLDVFMDIMNVFVNRTYRNIEMLDVQMYSSKYNIYKLYSEKFIQVGYFKCLEEFVFLHISHTGMFLPKSNNDLPEKIQKIYESIIEKYLQNSNKNFRVTMHG